MTRYLVYFLPWGVILVVLIYFFLPLYRQGVPRQEIVYSDFIRRAELGTIQQVKIYRDRTIGQLKNGEEFVTFGPANDETLKILRAKGVRIEFAPASRSSVLAYAIPVFTFVFGLLVGRRVRKAKT